MRDVKIMDKHVTLNNKSNFSYPQSSNTFTIFFADEKFLKQTKAAQSVKNAA